MYKYKILMPRARISENRNSSRPLAPATVQPYKVRTVGYIADIPHHSTHGTFNDDVMLTLIVGGQGSFRCNGVTVPVGKGMLGIVFPDQRLSVLMADPVDPYEHYFCRFTGGAAVATAERLFVAQGHAHFAAYQDWQALVDIWRQMCARKIAYEGRVAGDGFFPLDGLLAALLAQIEFPHPPSTGVGVLSRSGIYTYMVERISEPMNIELMARRFHVSKAHLCRKGRSLCGQTLVSMWRHIKLEWACNLLFDPDLSIADVARCVGYDDPYYFSNTFRKVYGISPTAWRSKGA